MHTLLILINDNHIYFLSNIYGLSFSSNPEDAMLKGCMMGSVRFSGLEQLVVNLPANASALTLDTIVVFERNLFQSVQTCDVASTVYAV